MQLYSKDIETDIKYFESDIELVEPSAKFKDDILEYKKEFIASNDSMNGTAGLQDMDSIDSWLSKNHRHKSLKTVETGFVPADLFLGVKKTDKRLVGMIHIRKELNDYLKKFGGHIGYSIRKSERKKGYATKMLKLGLVHCKYLGIEEVLLTCNKNNVASMKTIVKNGGEFENEILDGDNHSILRYWIRL